MSKLRDGIDRRRDPLSLDRKKDPLEKLSNQPASTSAAAYQGALGQTTPSYAPGHRSWGRQSRRRKRSKRSRSRYRTWGLLT